MKIIKILAIVMAISILFCLFGCTKQDVVKIGIAAPDVTHGWVAGVAYYAEKYCKENNIKYKIITSSDAAEMASAIDDLLAWGATSIVTYPQWTGMETVIQEVIDGGTPVVSFDIDIDATGIYKITGDNYGMGYRSAEYIASKVPSGSSIVVLSVPSLGSVSSLRLDGFYDYMKEINFDTSNVFEMAASSCTKEEGVRILGDVLSTHDNIDVVFSIDDELSIGAIQAIYESGRTDIKAITGGGGMQEYFKMINDSKYESLGLASALYSPSMITKAIDVAIKLSNNESAEPITVINTSIVTTENVTDYLDENNTIY